MGCRHHRDDDGAQRPTPWLVLIAIDGAKAVLAILIIIIVTVRAAALASRVSPLMLLVRLIVVTVAVRNLLKIRARSAIDLIAAQRFIAEPIVFEIVAVINRIVLSPTLQRVAVFTLRDFIARRGRQASLPPRRAVPWRRVSLRRSRRRRCTGG
jgi:hypothetical protein